MFNNDNNNFDQHDVFIQNELHKGNRLKNKELAEQRAMRKAYCKVNNIEFEEIEEEEERGFFQGSLFVVLCLIIISIQVTVLCSLIGAGNFLTNLMKVWF